MSYKLRINQVLLAIASIAFLLSSCDSGSNTANPFLVSDTSRVNKVVIEGKNKTVLQKRDGKWFVNDGYEAYGMSVKRLFQILSQVETKGKIPSEYADSVRNDISKNGIKLSVYDNDKELNAWTCGDFFSDYNSTTALIPGDSVPFLLYLPGVTKDLRPLLSDNQMYWMTAYVFDYEYFEIDEIALTYHNKTEATFHLNIRNDTAIIFDENNRKHPTNLRAVGRYLTYFKAVKFDSIENSSVLKNTEPVHTLLLLDNTGRRTKLETYPKFENDSVISKHKLYASLNDTTTVLMRWYELDLLLKEKSYFLVKSSTN